MSSHAKTVCVLIQTPECSHREKLEESELNMLSSKTTGIFPKIEKKMCFSILLLAAKPAKYAVI